MCASMSSRGAALPQTTERSVREVCENESAMQCNLKRFKVYLIVRLYRELLGAEDGFHESQRAVP